MVWHIIALILFAAAAVVALMVGRYHSVPIALIAAGLAVIQLASIV
jgi:hypothetical protein